MLTNFKRGLVHITMHGIKTFVFLDLETTGLPHLEHNRTRITELCMIAAQADHIELGVFPRVANKLSVCFNPMRPILPGASVITGLSNELLEHQSELSSDTVKMVHSFLSATRKPVCLVAHNGNRFDYPIFRAEIERVGGTLPDDLLCVDSLIAFRQLEEEDQARKAQKDDELDLQEEVPVELRDGYDEILCRLSEQVEQLEEQRKLSVEEVQKLNETTPTKAIISAGISRRGNANLKVKKLKLYNSTGVTLSYKLVDLYQRLVKKPATGAHEAEVDVSMMVTCAAVFGEQFVEYCNANAKRLNDIPMMKPGQRIG